MSITLLVACGLGLLVLAGLIVGLILLLQSGDSDAVSSARQDWMDSGRNKNTDS